MFQSTKCYSCIWTLKVTLCVRALKLHFYVNTKRCVNKVIKPCLSLKKKKSQYEYYRQSEESQLRCRLNSYAIPTKTTASEVPNTTHRKLDSPRQTAPSTTESRKLKSHNEYAIREKSRPRGKNKTGWLREGDTAISLTSGNGKWRTCRQEESLIDWKVDVRTTV